MSGVAGARAPLAPPECTHCGLPVPAGLVEAGAQVQFCCSGCRAVHAAIHEWGLDGFYALRDASDVDRRPARPSGNDYRGYDDAAFLELYSAPAPAGGRAIELYLESVHCAACVWLIEKLPSVLPGVRRARVEIGRQLACVEWDPTRVSLSRIASLLDRLGYAPHPHRRGRMGEVRRAEARRHLVRIGVAGACAGNVMLIAFALYGGMFHGMEERFRSLFRWSSLGLTVVALLGPGRVFLRGALSAVRTRTMHMDVPVAIGLGAGTLWGAWNTVRGAGEVYFESLTVVIFLLLVGRFVQQRQQHSAQDAVERLYRLTPATARRVEADGSVREVAVEALLSGDRVELRAGDSVPADGTILEGHSEFDLSLLTGESRPVRLAAGRRVHAGTVNLTRLVHVAVTATGEATRVGRLLGLIERLARERAPIVRLADRVARWFVALVLAWAAGTLALWWHAGPETALEHAIALLIVTCPCALGLATPLAVVSAIGRAARSGILIKGGEALERLARPGTMWLDKTGTLTEGRTRLASWNGPPGLRAAVLALEARVAHPVARAFVDAFAAEVEEPPEATATHEPGRGVRGVVAGRPIAVGAPDWIRGIVRDEPPWVAAAEAECIRRALTPVLVSEGDAIRAVAGVGDAVLPDAAESIARLRRLGWEVGLLSGDHPQVAAAVAAQLGIDPARAEGGASPERKVEVVRESARRGTVVMVGDGVNDAAAMSASTVGVAVHGGVEASLASADVYLRRPGLAPVVELARGAPRAVGVIRRNLAASLLYNLVAGGLATAGMIDPLVAAVLMPLSSITVVTLSFRSRTFDPAPGS